MKMRDISIAADDWAGCTVTFAESHYGGFTEFGVHVYFDDGSHRLRYSDGETPDEAIEALATRWEKLAAELRKLKGTPMEQER